MAYVHPEIGSVREVMLFDRHFEVENGVLATGTKHGLEITNMSRLVYFILIYLDNVCQFE